MPPASANRITSNGVAYFSNFSQRPAFFKVLFAGCRKAVERRSELMFSELVIGGSGSTQTTSKPAFANAHADVNPAIPPPDIRTSVVLRIICA